MLVGLKNNYAHDFKVGDFVYAYFSYDLKSYYSASLPETGYGVIVDAGSDYEKSVGYLLASTLIGVLINGKINWYSPNEILRVNSRDAS